MSGNYTRSGDDGTTGLLGDQRVPKHDLRPTVYGTIDEASSSLGLAKSLCSTEMIREIIHKSQYHLYLLMAELAATPENVEKFRSIDASHVDWLEEQIANLEGEIEVPQDFVIPGSSPATASIDLARTVIRRAERLTSQLLAEESSDSPHILPYLNRLSSLCFIMSLWILHSEGERGPSIAKREDS